MKAMREKLQLLYILFFFIIGIKAQETTPVHTSEYNNIYYDTERFGNNMVDVDLYRGQPNINIPLFNLNEKGLELKVALSYKSGGVKVNTPSQWTGQDWNLNVGKITRTVRGLQNDELDYYNVANPGSNGTDGQCWNLRPTESIDYSGQQKGFMKIHPLLSHENWKDHNNLKDILSKATAIAGNHRLDSEPDIFHFNFFGHTGYFFLGQDGQWKVASKSNLKIIFDKQQDMFFGLEEGFSGPWGTNCSIKTFGRFTFVDDKGYKYVFGDNNVRNIEINLRSFLLSQYFYPVYANAWNIVKVIDPNGIVLYEFTNENGGNLNPYLQIESPKYIRIPSEDYVGNSSNPIVHSTYNTSFPRFAYRAAGILFLPSYPVSIKTFSGNQIDFISTLRDDVEYYYNDGSAFSGNSLFESHFSYNISLVYLDNWGIFSNTLPFPQNTSGISGLKKRKLDNIKLTSSAGKVVNDIKLSYANTTQRIFLNSIKNNDKTYVFNYNNPNSLPPLLSNKTDMWGYFNNIPYKFEHGERNTGTYWRPFESNKFWELPVNTPYLYYGTLTDIYWPTGGKTTLGWESNSFTKRINPKTGIPLESNLPGGGVRVKNIISAEESREFFYNESFDYMDNNKSSGILVYEPVYYDNSNKALEILSINSSNPNANPSYPHNTYTGNILGINSKSIFEPADVVYSSVFEKKNEGFIQYSFYDYLDIPDFYYPGILPNNNALGLTKNDKSLERGLLKRKDFYDNTQKLIKREDYKYKKPNILLGRGVSYDLFTSRPTIPRNPPVNYDIPPDCKYCTTNASPYEIDYSDNLISEIFTTEIFKDGRNLQYFKKYYYKSPIDASYSLIDKIEEYPFSYDLSKFKTTKFDYAVDMDTSEPIIQDMISKNMVGIPLAVTKFNETQKPVSRVETIYAKNSTTNNFTLPVSVRNIKTGMYDYGSDLTAASKITFNVYDSRENVLQYTDESGLPTTIIYGYNRSQPIAKIVGADYNYVSSKVNIETLQDASDVDIDTASENLLISLLDDLRKNPDLKNYQITTYTYDPLVGLTSVTPPDGMREYYIYNSQNNKLEKVIDVHGNPIEEYKYHNKND